MRIVVFGSIKIRNLPLDARKNLDRIMATGAEILIGDASGIDTEVQKYLHARGYRNVTVYHTTRGCRNNVGDFPTVAIPGSYTDRDQAMCADADYGLGIWNGSSKGSARNIEQLGTRCRVVRA